MKNDFCQFCQHLSEEKLDDSFYAEYGSESKTHKVITRIDYCGLGNCECPESIHDCPILDNIVLPATCENCSELADCLTIIEDKGIDGLRECEFI